MSLIHRWDCTAGSGDLEDSVGSLDLTPQDVNHKVNWASGHVYGVNRNFVTIPWTRYPKYDGFLYNSTGLGANINNFTLGMCVRHLAGWIRDGCAIHLGGRYIRSWGFTIDITNTSRQIAVESEIDWGNFMTFIVVGRDGRYCDIYHQDDLTTPVRTIDSGYTGGFVLGGSYLRLGTYNGTDTVGSLEFADFSIYNHSMSQSDREDYLAQFVTTIPTSFSFNRINNDDFGGLVRWDENDGLTGSELTIESFGGSNVVKHTGDGGTCQMAVACEIRRDMDVIHMECDQYLPSTLEANHDIGSEWLVLGLFITPNTNQIFAVKARHIFGTPDYVSLYLVQYQNTGGNNNHFLTTTTVTYDEWHNYRLKVDLANGTIDFWYDGVSYAALTGLTLDIYPKQAYWGLNLGAHPENTGNFFYTRNHYVGETQRPEATGGSGSSKQFKRNALNIIFDEGGV